jgi:hypothetical protein
MSDLNFWTVDPHRTFSAEQLADASLPFADVRWNGELKLGKAVNSGGELSLATCAQQLLYEITDPAAYITPDVVVNVSNVTFEVLSPDQVLVKNASPALLSAPSDLLRLVPQDCGWRGWGEISYAGASCVERASVADHLASFLFPISTCTLCAVENIPCWVCAVY